LLFIPEISVNVVREEILRGQAPLGGREGGREGGRKR